MPEIEPGRSQLRHVSHPSTFLPQAAPRKILIKEEQAKILENHKSLVHLNVNKLTRSIEYELV